MPSTIAVIGSGPSGCYLAQFLHKLLPSAEITILDRLPVPYGLLRYGVAPDHQGTKALIQQFERLLDSDGVRFAGNVEIGVDVSLQEVRDSFDVVALATGVATDRALGIRGENSARVYGSGRVTRLLNSHPDEVGDGLELGSRTVIVGNGNVAIDVLRVLIKTEEDFLNSDVDDILRNRLAEPLEEINVIGRSSAHAAKFDKALIRELGRIRGVRFRMHGLMDAPEASDPLGQSKVDELRLLESMDQTNRPRIEVNFYFDWVPESIEGDGRVEGMTFRAAAGGNEHLTIETDSVITAIGFTHGIRETFARDELEGPATDMDKGILDTGLYCVGWFGKGARGTISEHRVESRSVAETIARDVESLSHSARKPGFSSLPQPVIDNSVGVEGWKAINAVELATASVGRYRRKINQREKLLAIARGDVAGSGGKSASSCQ